MEVLDPSLLKEAVDFCRLLVEDSSVVECMIKLQGCITLADSLRYQYIIEYHYIVIQEDLKKITFWKTIRKDFYLFFEVLSFLCFFEVFVTVLFSSLVSNRKSVYDIDNNEL